MTPDQFQVWQRAFFIECLEITKTKNNDYSPDSVTLGEVVETAFELGINVPQALAVHLRKHWSALTTYFQGQKPLASETVDGRLHDAMNYLVFLALWERERNTILDAMYFVAMRRPCECTLRLMSDVEYWSMEADERRRVIHGERYADLKAMAVPDTTCSRCLFITHLFSLG